MTRKSLTKGVATLAGAVFVAGAVSAGVTTIATSPSPQVAPVVFGVPLPQTPAPELQGPLLATLNALGDGGPFYGKATYVQGLGKFKSIGAERAYDGYVQKGYFPLSFVISDIDQNGPTATANVTANAANGAVATQLVTFVQGPSPSGWQLSMASLQSLLASVG